MTREPPAAAQVFISYRRAGTAMHAGRLYDAMTTRFGDHNVFMDLEMPPGVDFVERIKKEVSRCRALLVVIGPEWLGRGDGASGAQRLADPEDFVRLEVETALYAADVTVIPVLVGGAQMPDPDALPETLRPLARRNAIELTDLRWRFDCQRLMAALDDLLGEEPTDVGVGVEERGVGGGVDPLALLPLWLEGVAVAVAAGLLARAAFEFLRVADTASETAKIVGTIELRAISWAAIGAAVALWLSLRRGDRQRVLRRVATGLMLGGLAGALGGALYGALVYLPDHVVETATRNQIQIGALAITGGVLGIAIGKLWIPPRVAAGCVGGALGGALVQLATNATTHPQDQWALGLNCFAIVGVALFGLLVLDVRAAAASRRTRLAAEVARA